MTLRCMGLKSTRKNANDYPRDLHDEVGHDLVLMKLYLEMIALDTNRKEFQSIRPRLNEAIGLVSHAIDSVRRLVLDLGPAVFDELGFLPAVENVHHPVFSANQNCRLAPRRVSPRKYSDESSSCPLSIVAGRSIQRSEARFRENRKSIVGVYEGLRFNPGDPG